MNAALSQNLARFGLRAVMGLAMVAFVVKAGLELWFIPDAMPYAAMTLRGAIGNTAWYLLVAGLAQGAIFVAAWLVLGPKAPRLLLIGIGGAIALWGANVVENYDVVGLCLADNTLAPLTFAPSLPQTCLGLALGALFTLDPLRPEG